MNTRLLSKRIIAHIIDGIIIGIVIVFWIIVLVILKRAGMLSVEIVKILYPIGFIIICFLYFLQEGPLGKGQTIGKRALKIKVISEDGNVPSYKQVVIRNLLRVWDAMFFYGIGISRISHSEKGQRFGDKIAKTIVVEGTRGLSKVWILVFVVIVVTGGLLIWQY